MDNSADEFFHCFVFLKTINHRFLQADTGSQIPRPQSLANGTHPARHASLIHLMRQRLFQGALCHTCVIEIAETTSHARRTFTAIFDDTPLARRER